MTIPWHRALFLGVAAGASVYLFLDSFHIAKHPIGYGIFFGAWIAFLVDHETS